MHAGRLFLGTVVQGHLNLAIPEYSLRIRLDLKRIVGSFEEVDDCYRSMKV